jgi:hypothetical protein
MPFYISDKSQERGSIQADRCLGGSATGRGAKIGRGGKAIGLSGNVDRKAWIGAFAH